MKGFFAIILLAVAVSANNQCPGEQEVNWDIDLLLPHEDCDKFYKCAFGKPVEQRCPIGLNFNLKNWQCDWQNQVDCQDRNIAEELTPVKPEEGDASEAEIPEDILGVDENPGSIFVVPEVVDPEPEIEFLKNGCPANPNVHWLVPNKLFCNLFYYCVRGRRELRRCGRSLHFNPILQVCDWPWNAGCSSPFNGLVAGS